MSEAKITFSMGWTWNAAFETIIPSLDVILLIVIVLASFSRKMVYWSLQSIFPHWQATIYNL